MKNVTVTVPDDVYRSARIRAAEEGTSVSALVTAFLRTLSEEDARFARLEAMQYQVMAVVGSFSAGERVSREELHDRALR